MNQSGTRSEKRRGSRGRWIDEMGGTGELADPQASDEMGLDWTFPTSSMFSHAEGWQWSLIPPRKMVTTGKNGGEVEAGSPVDTPLVGGVRTALGKAMCRVRKTTDSSAQTVGGIKRR